MRLDQRKGQEWIAALLVAGERLAVAELSGIALPLAHCPLPRSHHSSVEYSLRLRSKILNKILDGILKFGS
jgi:hypothetical protein